jgi:putative two-component system response regulator
MMDLSSATVMIVDDTVTNVDILVETLGETYNLSVAMDGESALEAIAEGIPDLILLDIMMPGMDGYEVCEHLKQKDETRSIPIIFLTAMTGEQDEARGLALGAVDYITKPFSPSLVKARVRNQLELKLHRDHLEELVKERTRELVLTQAVLIESLATLAEFRDPETGGHIKRTQNYVKALAMQLKNKTRYHEDLDDRTVELLYQTAPLHDIGKVAVIDDILHKPGKLTDDEFEEMKQHTVYGHKALKISEQKLKNSAFLRLAGQIAYTHQEKWDGSGYPQGLKAETIPLPGRLMALADVYDALISKRTYKQPMTHEKAVQIIKQGRATHFDPDVVDAFLDIQDTFRNIAHTYADFEDEQVALELKKENAQQNVHRVKDILLVEDNEINLEIMLNQLTALGFRVDTAINGEDALKKIGTREYDVILTDLDMPVMDGYSLVEAIRRLPGDAAHPIAIFAITASEYDLTEEKARSLGFSGYMLKPLDPQVLQQKLTERG